MNTREEKDWENNRIINLLKQQGLQHTWPKFKKFKNKKYQDPRKWAKLCSDSKKLTVDFQFTPNDILKFQKLAVANDFDDWDDEERKYAENITVKVDSALSQVTVLGQERDHVFAYDRVLGWDLDQEHAFDAVCLQGGILKSAMEGTDSTLLAYGQTGSGKTYTMFGCEPIAKCPQSDEGIVPRAFRWIFDKTEADDDIASCKVYIEAVEVYMGKLRDLFEPTVKNKPKRLRIGETKETFGKEEEVKPKERHTRYAKPPKRRKKGEEVKTYIKIDGAFEAVAQNAKEIRKLIGRAWKNRSTEKTDANAVSSRSHMLLRTRIVIKKTDGAQVQSRLTFGDLAGSEKTKYSNVRGRQMKQAQDINKQLFVLRQCVDAILNGRGRIPYPDACLTKVLQKSVEGKTQLTFLTCASPHRMNRSETLGTLQFGNQCRQLEVTVVKNVTQSKESLQNKLKAREEELEELRLQMRKLQHTHPQGVDPESTRSEDISTSSGWSDEAVENLKKELEMKSIELKLTKDQLAQVSNDLRSAERSIRSMSNMRSCSINMENLAPYVLDDDDGSVTLSRPGSHKGSMCSMDEEFLDFVQVESENQELKDRLLNTQTRLNESQEHIKLKNEQMQAKDNILNSLQQENQALTTYVKHRTASNVSMLESREEEISHLRAKVNRLERAASVDNSDEKLSWSQKFEYRKAQSKLARLEKEVSEKNLEIENLKRSNTKLQLKNVRLHMNAPLNVTERRKRRKFSLGVKQMRKSMSLQSPISGKSPTASQAFLSSSSCDSGSSSDHALNVTIDRQKGLIKEMLQLLTEDEDIDASDVGEVENVIMRLKTEKLRRATLGSPTPMSPPSCGPVDIFSDELGLAQTPVIDALDLAITSPPLITEECYE